MVNKPLVRIIIPCYNQESCISETITSILESTYSNMEIIIVDDGSTDSSVQIVEGWRKKDARIIFSYQSNGGPSVARNHAIRKASENSFFRLMGTSCNSLL